MVDQYTFADGKYTVISDNGKLNALRYGEPWQDLSGNNLVYWMLVESISLKEKLDEVQKDANKWQAISMLYPGGSDALFEQLQKIAKDLADKASKESQESSEVSVDRPATPRPLG